MKESSERTITVGFKRSPRDIFNEMEQVSAQMMREGWTLIDSCVEDGLGCIHLFFERQVLDFVNNDEELTIKQEGCGHEI